MNWSEDDILEMAWLLEPEAQRRIARTLLESLEVDSAKDSELGPEWAVEIKRRIATIDDGTATLIPAREALELLRARHASRVGKADMAGRPTNSPDEAQADR
jgi:hypothetical protein